MFETITGSLPIYYLKFLSSKFYCFYFFKQFKNGNKSTSLITVCVTVVQDLLCGMVSVFSRYGNKLILKF